MRFETAFTSQFVRRSLPAGAKRVLEVGCGAGELAAALSGSGFSIVAIDSDCDAVSAAQKSGVNALVSTWPNFDGGQFDAVLFTRSLHHIHPLDKAVRRAADSLVEGGRIIVEDFAYEAADERTLAWFTGVLQKLARANLLVEGDEFLNSLCQKTGTLAAWRKNHEADLHASADILVQMQKIFGEVICESGPYCFRYLANSIAPTADRDMILRELAAQENALISEGAIVPIGRRFVAERRTTRNKS